MSTTTDSNGGCVLAVLLVVYTRTTCTPIVRGNSRERCSTCNIHTSTTSVMVALYERDGRSKRKEEGNTRKELEHFLEEFVLHNAAQRPATVHNGTQRYTTVHNGPPLSFSHLLPRSIPNRACALLFAAATAATATAAVVSRCHHRRRHQCCRFCAELHYVGQCTFIDMGAGHSHSAEEAREVFDKLDKGIQRSKHTHTHTHTPCRIGYHRHWLLTAIAHCA
jgi:hypothetical protein